MAFGAATTVYASPTTSSYSMEFGDAITGDNEFTSGDDHFWFVNTGADSYANDFYERPTVQTYTNQTAGAAIGTDSELVVGNSYAASGTSGPSYFGYLDIVKGHFGYDSQFAYFGIELFSTLKVSQNGDTAEDFGESSYYRVRLSEDSEGAGGLMLSGEAGADYAKPGEYASWETTSIMGYLDTDRKVGGPDGITTVNEKDDRNGYEDKVISDGAVEAGNKPDILWSRYSGTGPLVEFALDYVAFNDFFPDYAINPKDINDLVFEATRGLKGNSSYLWNDTYSLDEAGTPYDVDNQPQNVYELDTLRADLTVIPAPGALLLAGLGTGCIGFFRRRQSL